MHGPTQAALLPTPSAETRPHQNRDRSTARASEVRCDRVQIPWRARARFVPRSIGRHPAGHAHRAVRTWRGCVMGQRGARSSPRRRPGLDRTNTTIGRQHRLPKCIVIMFESSVARGPRAFRPAKYRSTPRRARAPRQCGLGVVALWPDAGRAPPHAVGMGSTAPTPRQVGGTGFGS